jgi:hypothetical protein
MTQKDTKSNSIILTIPDKEKICKTVNLLDHRSKWKKSELSVQ